MIFWLPGTKYTFVAIDVNEEVNQAHQNWVVDRLCTQRWEHVDSIRVVRVNHNLITFVLGAQVKCRADCKCLIEKKMRSFGPLTGKGHWKPVCSPGNQIPMPTPEAFEKPMRVVAILSYGDHSTDLSIWIPLDSLTWQINQRSLHLMALLTQIGAFGRILPDIFSYNSQRAGQRCGKTFNDQLTHPCSHWNSRKVLRAPRTVKAVQALMSSNFLTSDILTVIASGSTLKLIIGIKAPQICFCSLWGRPISSHSSRRQTWSDGRIVRIKFKISGNVKGEIDIHITFEGLQVPFKNCNPQD